MNVPAPKKFIPPTKEKILHFQKDDKIIIDVWAFKVKHWDRATGKLNLKFAGRITGIKPE